MPGYLREAGRAQNLELLDSSEILSSDNRFDDMIAQIDKASSALRDGILNETTGMIDTAMEALNATLIRPEARAVNSLTDFTLDDTSAHTSRNASKTSSDTFDRDNLTGKSSTFCYGDKVDERTQDQYDSQIYDLDSSLLDDNLGELLPDLFEKMIGSEVEESSSDEDIPFGLFSKCFLIEK